MASTLLYDCFSGISGDMHIGAMVDIGVPGDYLRNELSKLPLASEFDLKLQSEQKMGITGTLANVEVRNDVPKPHRHLSDIVEIIQAAGYTETVEQRAVGIFRALGEAESKIHGIGIDQVHFHEVGATDSIVDIVAAALCLAHLDVDTILSRSVEVGSGMVRCAHGIMPVPAPATAELLKGVPCHYGRVDSEATTPTGAAILKYCVDEFGEPDNLITERVGYGIGHKDFSVPNVLRVMLGTVPSTAMTMTPAPSAYESETNVEVECNIDDMSPEAFQPLIDNLFKAGAKDVMVTPGLMKKSRPGNKVSVLTPTDQLDTIVEHLVTNSTTIGVRFHNVQKWMLPREAIDVPTSLGKVRVKRVTLPSGHRKWKSEYDDVIALARARGDDYLRLKEQIDQEINAWMNK